MELILETTRSQGLQTRARLKKERELHQMGDRCRRRIKAKNRGSVRFSLELLETKVPVRSIAFNTVQGWLK